MRGPRGVMYKAIDAVRKHKPTPPIASIVRQLKRYVEKLCGITHHLTIYWTATMPASSCKQNPRMADRHYNPRIIQVTLH